MQIHKALFAHALPNNERGMLVVILASVVADEDSWTVTIDISDNARGLSSRPLVNEWIARHFVGTTEEATAFLDKQPDLARISAWKFGKVREPVLPSESRFKVQADATNAPYASNDWIKE